MIYEYPRLPLPARPACPRLLKRFENHTTKIWEETASSRQASGRR